MKLSEAIFLGSTISPQTFGRLKWSGRSLAYKTCALGAAYDAAGILQGLLSIPASAKAERLIVVEEAFPWALSARTHCPICGGNEGVLDVVIDLNDNHRWTRERIAEWVAKIEPPDAIATDHEQASGVPGRDPVESISGDAL